MEFDIPKPCNHRKVECHASNIGISLLWDELVYDIKYQIWRIAVNSEVEGKNRKALTITSDDDDWLLRVISAGFDQVKGELKPYLHAHEHIVTDELLEHPDEYIINMTVEPGWRGTPSVIMEYAHLFIVKYAMSEWFMLSDPQRAANCLAEANSYLAKIASEANYYDVETPIFIL